MALGSELFLWARAGLEPCLDPDKCRNLCGTSSQLLDKFEIGLVVVKSASGFPSCVFQLQAGAEKICAALRPYVEENVEHIRQVEVTWQKMVGWLEWCACVYKNTRTLISDHDEARPIVRFSENGTPGKVGWFGLGHMWQLRGLLLNP